MTAPKLAIAASRLGGRGYSIPTWLDADGKPTVVPSVTTVLKVLDKGGVTQWAVNNTAAYAVANIDALLNRTEEQGYRMLQWYWKRTPDPDSPEMDIYNYHDGVLHDAADMGTYIHEYIEHDQRGELADEPVNEQQIQMIAAWERFKADHDIIPVLIEATVVNREEGYAGTLDWLWKIKCLHLGEPCLPHSDERHVATLGDTKSARGIWPDHKKQLGALGACYDLMLELPDGSWVQDVLPAFEQYAFLHIRPDDWDSKGNFIPAYCKLELADAGELALEYEGFLGALAEAKTRKNVRLYLKSKEDK